MITRVILKQWKSHEKTDIKLGDGTNVLVGIMGSGKSAVLDGICYGLFGTTPAVQNRTVKLEDLIRNRPRPALSAEVEVHFVAADENEYVVKRILERGKGTTLSELRTSDGRLIESPQATRVNESISMLLKIDYDLFERAIYSEQNRLDYFLKIRRGQRMQKMDELLGINKFELARKNMTTLINRVRTRVKDREELVAELEKDQNIASITVLEKEIESLETLQKEEQREFDGIQPKIDIVKAKLKQFQNWRNEISKMEKLVGELEGALSALKQQAVRINARFEEHGGGTKEDIEKTFAELKKTQEDSKRKYNAASEELSKRKEKVAEMEAKAKVARDRLEDLMSKLGRMREIQKELSQLGVPEIKKRYETIQELQRKTENDLALAKSDVESLERTIKELEGAGAVCPVCELPLEEVKKNTLLQQREKIVSEKRATVSKLEERLAQLNSDFKRIGELHERCLNLSKQVEGKEELEEERIEIQKEIDSIVFALEGARDQVRRTESDVKVYRERLDEFQKQFSEAEIKLNLFTDLEKVNQDIEEKELELRLAQDELKLVKDRYAEEEVRELEVEHDSLARAQERIKAEIMGREGLINVKKKTLSEAKNRFDELEKYRAEVRGLDKAIDGLQKIQAALARSQTSLRQHFIEAVNGTMSELWRDIYPYNDYTNIRLSVEGGESSGDYVLQLSDREGNWVPVEGVTSGGEQTCASLTLRIAFAVVLTPVLSWMVLDEPTHNLDSEAISDIAQVLREKIPEVLEQVILITHEEKLDSAVSGFLYHFSRDKSRDGPTVVQKIAVSD